VIEIVGLLLLGLIAGTIAASLGIGGGVMYVPVLVVAFSFDQHVAQGTSLAVIVGTTIVGAITHARLGNVRWRISIPVGIGGVLGAIAGSWIALGLEGDVLRRMFGVFLLVVAARMAWRAYRLSGRSAPEPDPS
jgi:uncharacterized membrane protein YfcA